MKRSARWPGIVVVGISMLVFAPLCTHDFTWWDDGGTVHHNPWLNPPTLASVAHYWSSAAYGLYAPVTYSVWMILARIARLDQPDSDGIALNPWVFHSANVIIHALAALATFALLRRITRRDLPAMLGALLFALHPMQVEAVGWISGLKDLLAGCLDIVALWRFTVRLERTRDDSILPDVWGTLAFIVAMLSKPSAMVVPFVGAIIARFILQREWRIAIRSMAVWMLLAIPIAIIARFAQGTLGIPPAPLWFRPLIAGDSYAFYFYKLIAPLELGIDYGRTPASVMRGAAIYVAWLVPVGLLMASWIARRRVPWALGALLVFMVPILPVSGLTMFLFQFTSTVADHYVYFAMLGPAIALAILLRTIGEDRPIAPLIVSAILFLLAGRSLLQTLVWANDKTLFEHALVVNPRSAVAHNNLGHYYSLRLDAPNAAREFRAAIELNPEYSDAWDNLARVLAAQGDVNGSVAAIERTIQIRAAMPPALFPDYMEAHNSVGQVLLERGELDRAIAHFEALLKLKPDHEEARMYLRIARERKRNSAVTLPPSSASTVPSN